MMAVRSTNLAGSLTSGMFDISPPPGPAATDQVARGVLVARADASDRSRSDGGMPGGITYLRLNKRKLMPRSPTPNSMTPLGSGT